MRKTFCLLAALLLTAGPAGASDDGAGNSRECAAGMNFIQNQWSGRRVAFLGDSITDERHIGTTKNYWQYLAEMLDLVPFVYGINGHQWSDVLGQARKLYAERGDAVDAVVVFAGTNDFNAGVPLGEWYEVPGIGVPMPGPAVGMRMRRTLSADPGTLCGRINAVLAFLKEHYPTKQVILLTPLHRGYARFSDRNIQPDESYPNRLGLYADAYVAKIREAGSVWAVPVIDLNSISGLYPVADSHVRYFSDGQTDRLHPNAAGSRTYGQSPGVSVAGIPSLFRLTPPEKGRIPAANLDKLNKFAGIFRIFAGTEAVPAYVFCRKIFSG